MSTSSHPQPDSPAEIHEEDLGLVHDIRTLVDRRAVLGLFGGIAVTTLLAACAPETVFPEVPDETGGPFPGDGSNGINVLDDSGIVRRDIRPGFGASTTTVRGVPLEIELTVLDALTGEPLPGAAVYLWHCSPAGLYSLYSPGAENDNYLRGVQSADERGVVTFTTVYPGCYRGRWPHAHFEVYADVATAVSSGPIVKTSQLALPQDASEAVYATTGYAGSTENLAGVTLATDSEFRDDSAVRQLATVSGSLSEGYRARLTIGV